MAALLDRETADGGTFRDVNVRGATLEDVFLKLTGRALRDSRGPFTLTPAPPLRAGEGARGWGLPHQ
jgi:hypothetical protein